MFNILICLMFKKIVHTINKRRHDNKVYRHSIHCRKFCQYSPKIYTRVDLIVPNMNTLHNQEVICKYPNYIDQLVRDF